MIRAESIIFVIRRGIMKKEYVKKCVIPEGEFCGYNCADGCIYWNPRDLDHNGRQYCSHYHCYYYPRERQGCLSFEKR